MTSPVQGDGKRFVMFCAPGSVNLINMISNLKRFVWNVPTYLIIIIPRDYVFKFKIFIITKANSILSLFVKILNFLVVKFLDEIITSLFFHLIFL